MKDRNNIPNKWYSLLAVKQENSFGRIFGYLSEMNSQPAKCQRSNPYSFTFNIILEYILFDTNISEGNNITTLVVSNFGVLFSLKEGCLKEKRG